jgi:hypothetical protein
MQTSYIIKVSAFVDGRRVDGEYEGGKSLADARKEAAEFVSLVKQDPYACVKICKANTFGRLFFVEVAHGI